MAADQHVTDMWLPATAPNLSNSISNPAKIAEFALQLRKRERDQLANNFEQEYFEIATSFIWSRTMALLKKQLAALGTEFIGELLQRPDIDEFTELNDSISDGEAISLARDLGILNKTQTLRLLQSQTIVRHFVSLGHPDDDDPDDEMTREEAVSCFRICVQSVLGHESISAAQGFQDFRTRLRSESLKKDDEQLTSLVHSPYFFRRTTVSILLALLKESEGAAYEHCSRNAQTIVPMLWSALKDTERWQVGQAYASAFNDGDRKLTSTLRKILVEVRGFDFVPENLRSGAFIRIANAIIDAHQGVNNFYNEPGPMRELESLGTSIPGPAMAKCMTAILCVKLGNPYGVSNAAQGPADKIISNLSEDRWTYYMNEILPEDRTILTKLCEEWGASRWLKVARTFDFEPDERNFIQKGVRGFVKASVANDRQKVQSSAKALLKHSLGF